MPANLQYAELHCLSNFSFLRAASHPEELIKRAAELGYTALAVTDRHSLAGIVRTHSAASDVKNQPSDKLHPLTPGPSSTRGEGSYASDITFRSLVGVEVYPADAPAAVLLPMDRAAYGRLTRLLTLGKSRAPKGECFLNLANLAHYGENIIACVFGDADHPLSVEQLVRYREVFEDRAYLLAEAHRGPDDAAWFAQLRDLSRQSQLPLVAAGNVYYHTPDRQPLQDVLTAIRLGCTVAECGTELLANAERHLKPLDELEWLYESLPGAIERTIEVAARCTFSLSELRYEYPEELAPPGITPLEHLRSLTWQGAAVRYPAGITDKVRELLHRELQLIEELHYEAYFLTVWDIVRFARSRDILCQGRGSAANSAVCYCLGVTAVDPDRVQVLFERFISRERNEAPDIDIDFEHERREEVLQYLYDKYGRERAAMTAEVISYRSRSAVREVGKALGMDLERIEAIGKTLFDHHHRAPETKWQDRCRDGGLDPEQRLGRQFISLVKQLVGFPRHLSQHVGGMVVTRGPLCEIVPIENAAMPGRTVIEWNKDDLDTLGILKVDCLALGMLTAIRKCFDLIHRHYGRQFTLATIPSEDPVVYDMICEADTIGVFQIESRAQMSMLPRLKPRSYYDLVIEVSIVRPGPIQGNMVHPYLRRRNQEEPIEYPSAEVEKVLERTLGVPIFQEQAMQLAIVAGGFTPGEADQLRRAMAAWRKPGIISMFQQQLVDGMLARGYSPQYAEQLFQQISGFGEYGFPESHAASFALLVYVSSWLKCYYPAAFCAAIINSQPMGFYAPAQLVRDARAHGVELRPVDVNRSEWDLTLEPTTGDAFAVRLGFRLLTGMPQAAALQIVAARHEPYASVSDLSRRARIGQPVLTLLARGDALHSLSFDRRTALWHALGQRREGNRPLFETLPTVAEAADVLPCRMTPFEEVLADYHTAELSLRAHPISFARDELDRRKCLPTKQLADVKSGMRVRTAGLVLMRQRPSTAKGITFVTLEDETGVANIIVHPGVWQRDRAVANSARVWIVDGRVESQGRVIHVIAARLIDFTPAMGVIKNKSRDFR